MVLTRRRLLVDGGLGLFVACARPGLALGGDPPALPAGAPLLTVILLRGGADGLHLVPPVGDTGYAKLRGALALSEARPFATGFGLHPELEALSPLVERGELAALHCAGSPHPTRSHFEAQDFLEAGEPGATTRHDGWLARGLRGAARPSPFAALAIAPELPLSLRGSGSFAMADADSFGVPGADRGARQALAALYAEGDDPVSRAGRQALAALAEFERRMGPGRPRFLRRPSLAGYRLADGAEQVLRLERAGIPLEAVFLESGGWDTHIRQGAEAGAMALAIRDLAQAIAALDAGLRERRALRVVALSEFGRTVRPNGSGGTDHGHGGVVLVAGTGVRGGVHGDWPGLEERSLYEGRDLPVSADWRSALHEVLAAHLGGRPPADTFPGFEPRAIGLFG
jgi:uncharacterized protein (DUF1501 family)